MTLTSTGANDDPLGAVYKPVAEIVPDAAFPPETLLTSHTGFASGVPFSVALNCIVCPGKRYAKDGVITGLVKEASPEARLLHPQITAADTRTENRRYPTTSRRILLPTNTDFVVHDHLTLDSEIPPHTLILFRRKPKKVPDVSWPFSLLELEMEAKIA